jgi:hypothetical protein
MALIQVSPSLSLRDFMFDDLTAYYHDNVVTEFADYLNASRDGVAGRSRDLRKALVAATALFHLHEHLPTPGRPSRADAEKACPDYALLGDVVNAAKHKEINKTTPHGAPLVHRAASLAERQMIIEYSDAAGPYRHGLKTVVVRLADGSERNLLDVMTNVINYWELQLHALGVLASPRTFSYEDPNRFRARSECNGGRLDLEIVQGQRFLQSVQLLRFNHATAKVEPIDLTHAAISGSLYRPSCKFEVRLTHNASGKEFKKTVLFSESEGMQLHALSTDEEREAFALNTLTVRDALQELAASAGMLLTGSSSDGVKERGDVESGQSGAQLDPPGRSGSAYRS